MYSTSRTSTFNWAFGLATSFMVIMFFVLIGALVFMAKDSGVANHAGNAKSGSYNDHSIQLGTAKSRN